MARIAVAVSGGADSLFALISLQEQGHDILALHGLFLPQAKVPLGLESICTQFNIPLHIQDLRHEFDELIINPFIKSYAKGLTPNPCSLCNAHIKFGLLLDAALGLNVDLFATGHYATKQSNELTSPLAKGADQSKEQSYFLALVPKNRLEKIIFPLEKTIKSENVKYLLERNIDIPIAGESQEICFVPEDAYRPFVQSEAAKRQIHLPRKGPILIYEQGHEKQLGKHDGLWQYTEGQRRGLGVAYSAPLYVCTKDMQRNALILGTKENLILNGCIVDNLNIFVQKSSWPSEIYAKVRYRQKESLATVSWIENLLRIDFHTSQSPTACGQVAVLYDNNGQVLAGGIIKEIF